MHIYFIVSLEQICHGEILEMGFVYIFFTQKQAKDFRNMFLIMLFLLIVFM